MTSQNAAVASLPVMAYLIALLLSIHPIRLMLTESANLLSLHILNVSDAILQNK